MTTAIVQILQQQTKPFQILKWKVKEGNSISIGSVLFTYVFNCENERAEQRKYKSNHAGTLIKIKVTEGQTVKPGEALFDLKPCNHPTIMNDMCAECGADLRKDDLSAVASVPMVHAIPDLKVSEEQAQKIGKADSERLLKDRKLVLLVDLDQTLIHTTNDNIPPNLKDVYHFQLYGPNSPWYHTRLRPGTHNFLENICPYFELHICTFGARNYAHTIAMFLDEDQSLFSNRILSRDECFDSTSKKANLKALFPCGDNMVCIIDDREDVWSNALNLIHVKPYHFFQNTGDINAPPGLGKYENDKNTSGVDLSKMKTKSNEEITDDKDLKEKSEVDKGLKEKSEVNDDNDLKEKSTSSEEVMEAKSNVTEERNNITNEKGDEVEKINDGSLQKYKEQTSATKKKSNILEENDNVGQEKSNAVKEKSNAIKNKDSEKLSEKTEFVKKGKEKINIVNENMKEPPENLKEPSAHLKEPPENLKELPENLTEPSENESNLHVSNTLNNEKVSETATNPKNRNDSKEDELIDVEDADDYLLYLEDILKRIHDQFYDEYDKMKGVVVPDLKKVIPSVRSKVLKGTKLVFSGLVPTHIKLEQSKAYQVAKSLGAEVTQDLEADTTHLVAVRPGTAKVNAGKRRKNLKVVTPDWLWCCAERWEHVNEKIFTLSSKGSKNRHPPPHCSSPHHSITYEKSFVETKVGTPLVFTKAEIRNLYEDAKDDLDDDDDDDESDEEAMNKMILNKLKRKHNEEEEESSSSGESLTAEYPKKYKKSKTAQLNIITSNREDENNSDLDQDSQDTLGSLEARNEIEDSEWNIMGAALEKEFLCND